MEKKEAPQAAAPAPAPAEEKKEVVKEAPKEAPKDAVPVAKGEEAAKPVEGEEKEAHMHDFMEK